MPPTPHPLTLALGAVLSPLGAMALPVAAWIGLLSLGALAVVCAVLAYRLGGKVAAAVAGFLLLTRPPVLYWGSLSYLDVPYAALIVTALLFGLGPAPRPRGVLICLAVAGLLRPEAWLLSGAYALYAHRSKRLPFDATAGLLVLSAPLIWAVVDWVTTGSPVYSFTMTSGVTRDQARTVSLPGLLVDLPKEIARAARPGVLLVAVLGAALAWTSDRRSATWVVAGAALALAGTALVVAAGTPLNVRYVFVAPAVACAFAGVGVAAALRLRGVWRAVGLGAVAVLAVSAAIDVPKLREGRTIIASERRMITDLKTTARASGVDRDGRVVAPSRAAPYLSLWLGESPACTIADPADAEYLVSNARRGSAKAFVGRNPDGDARVVAGVPGARLVRRTGEWTLWRVSSAAPARACGPDQRY